MRGTDADKIIDKQAMLHKRIVSPKADKHGQKEMDYGFAEYDDGEDGSRLLVASGAGSSEPSFNKEADNG